MLARARASSSSSMAGLNSVLFRVVWEPKPFSRAKPRLLWVRKLLLSFRDTETQDYKMRSYS